MRKDKVFSVYLFLVTVLMMSCAIMDMKWTDEAQALSTYPTGFMN